MIDNLKYHLPMIIFFGFIGLLFTVGPILSEDMAEGRSTAVKILAALPEFVGLIFSEII